MYGSNPPHNSHLAKERLYLGKETRLLTGGGGLVGICLCGVGCCSGRRWCFCRCRCCNFFYRYTLVGGAVWCAGYISHAPVSSTEGTIAEAGDV